MTISPVKETPEVYQEQKNSAVQNELQKTVLKDTMKGDMAKQFIQLIAAAQPPQNPQQTAQNQIARGFVDIKI